MAPEDKQNPEASTPRPAACQDNPGDSRPPRRLRPTVHFLIGMPGSGKSVFAEKLLRAYPTARIVSSDGIRELLYGSASEQGIPSTVFSVAHEIVASCLSVGQDVIYDATNLERTHRRDTLAYMRQLGAKRILGYWFRVPISECTRRNQIRNRVVPRSVILKMAAEMERWPPERQEGFDELFVVDRLGRRRRLARPAARTPDKRVRGAKPGVGSPGTRTPRGPGTRKHP